MTVANTMTVSNQSEITDAGSELPPSADHGPSSMAEAARQAFSPDVEPVSGDPGRSSAPKVGEKSHQGAPSERLPGTQSQPDAGASL